MKALEILKSLEVYIKDYGCSNGTLDLIDDLQKELEELQNRKCEGCKHYNPSDYDKKEEILDQWVELHQG